jgi:hypothetical protein
MMVQAGTYREPKSYPKPDIIEGSSKSHTNSNSASNPFLRSTTTLFTFLFHDTSLPSLNIYHDYDADLLLYPAAILGSSVE